jgi:hypothetical protein
MNYWDVCPDTRPSRPLDRPGRLAWLALEGYPQLAADTILDKDNHGRLGSVVGNAFRQLNLVFMNGASQRKSCYEAMTEVALNLVGMERREAGFSDEETARTLDEVVQGLAWWESVERKKGEPAVARAVIENHLMKMKKVLMGRGMVSKMAEEIEKELNQERLVESFVSASKRALEGNVYYQMVDSRMSKFGNDSATGLRWARHLGAVQVSSNPVSAERAFEEMPELYQVFKGVVDAHPEWVKDADGFGDEITMFGTITSLLPNLLDFRPIAILSGFQDGIVSLQLNPYKADSFEGSIGDALKIYTILQEVLEVYDSHLMGDKDFPGRGRPNLVFKVAAGDKVAVEITETLDRMGIGTNNTVTATVAQELRLTMAAVKGLSEALKSGIPITQVYMTNMEGRLEDHIREAKAEEMLQEALGKTPYQEAAVKAMAEKLGVLESVEKAGTTEAKIAVLCKRKALPSLTEQWFVDAVKMDAESLRRLESDIRMVGILVTRRVFEIAFTPKAISKWVQFIEMEYGLTRDQAMDVMRKVDLLPASLRRAEDTYLVQGGKNSSNLTITAFPDQQLKVLMRSKEQGFKLSDFENTLGSKPDPELLGRLMKIGDFVKAYELTPELADELGIIGLDAPKEDGGVAPVDWPSFPVCVKTLHEFKGAYSKFKDELVPFVKGMGAQAPMIRR